MIFNQLITEEPKYQGESTDCSNGIRLTAGAAVVVTIPSIIFTF